MTKINVWLNHAVTRWPALGAKITLEITLLQVIAWIGGVVLAVIILMAID